jgi:PspA associated protein B
MGFLDAILGRSRPVKPNLDVLFAVPAASLTLQAGLGLAPTGPGAVCVTSAEGQTVAENDVLALLSVEAAGRTASSRDEYGYTWITVHRPDADVSALVTDLHAANTTLVDAGYGTGLLCTVIGFAGTVADQPRRVGLVYLFKRGTFYPFAPVGAQQRDTTLELRIREQLGVELPVEADLGRWFPIWNSPGI